MRQRLYLRVEDDAYFGPDADAPLVTLREYPIVAPLSEAVVAHLFAYRESIAQGSPVSERVLPDGFSRLIFSFAEGRCTARLVGPMTEAIVLKFTEDVDGVSIQLRPGASALLFGVAAHDVAHRCVPWEDIAPADARCLPERLCQAPCDADRVRTVQQVLASMCTRTATEDLRRVRAALALLNRAGGALPIAEVGRPLGLGERRLQQLFQAYVGISPRACARLVRFHRCLRELRRGGRVNWSDLALRLGFYDQAHLANDFRALSGLAPAHFLAHAISDFSKTAHPSAAKVRG